MSSLQLGRLLIATPITFNEQLGDPLGQQGGAVVPAPRTPPQYPVVISTTAADGQTDTLAARLSIRRRLRSLANNTPLKLGAFLYMQYADDTEQNGWYAPDQTTLQDIVTSAGLATGWWQTNGSNWWLLGRQRTHREARQVWMKDLRTGDYARDFLGWVYSTDFASVSALALSVLAPGASSAADSVTGGVVSGAPLASDENGAQCSIVQGLGDLAVIAYERPESDLSKGDVVCYDRRGAGNAPTSGPGSTWEEVYGPDYPWNWLTSGQPSDAPLLDNGLVRVRYDASAGKPGFRVDVWNGTAWSEQGKVTVYRVGDSSGYCDTFVSAGIAPGDNGGWTPERCVIQCVLSNSADAYSREVVYITVARGQTGARFEVYPAPKSAGTSADARLVWTMDGPDSEDTIMFEPATSTPASGHDDVWSSLSSSWTSASGTFSSTTANFLSVVRCIGGASTVGPYQVNLAVVQQSVTFAGISDTSAYGGTAQNAVQIAGAGGMGYLRADVSFAATQSAQVQSGTITAFNPGSPANGYDYRVFGLASGTWSDYGEYSGSSVSTGSSADVVAFMTQDRTRTGATYGGCRDAGQAVLYDSRMLGSLVAR